MPRAPNTDGAAPLLPSLDARDDRRRVEAAAGAFLTAGNLERSAFNVDLLGRSWDRLAARGLDCVAALSAATKADLLGAGMKAHEARALKRLVSCSPDQQMSGSGASPVSRSSAKENPMMKTQAVEPEPTPEPTPAVGLSRPASPERPHPAAESGDEEDEEECCSCRRRTTHSAPHMRNDLEGNARGGVVATLRRSAGRLRAPAEPRSAYHELGVAVASGRQRACRWAPGCRFNSLTSALFIFALLGTIGGITYAGHGLAGHTPGWLKPWVQPPAPPIPCGVWPYDHPCGTCAYGVQAQHSVKVKETCTTIARLYKVPPFDLFNRNKSKGCCHVTCNGPPGSKDCATKSVAVTDLIDICNGPTLEQWKDAGHPFEAPEKIVGTFIGATPGGIRAPLSLPDSINVGMLFEVADTSAGVFTVGPQFTDDSTTACVAQVNPTVDYRGMSRDSPEGKRVWLISWNTNAGRWRGSDPSWDIAAADSLAEIILRWRLDGIDVNIESSRGSFSQHMCNVFQLLRDRLGPALITTITPYTQTASMYAQLATACPDLVTWVNWEGYIHRGSSTMRYSQWNEYAAMASHFGYEKMAFGIMSASGGSSPSGPYSNPSLPQMDQIIKQAEAVSQGAGPRGVFFWTAESSSRWTPAWCFENIMEAALNGQDPPYPPGTCT